MKKVKYQTDYFQLQGQLNSYVIKASGKIKYLRVQHGLQEYWLKPDQTIREQLTMAFAPGCWLDIVGQRGISPKTGKVKLAAAKIQAIAPPPLPLKPPQIFATDPTKKCPKTAKARILICQKSSCRKRGGAAVCDQLEMNLREHGLSGQVAIQSTGCLKACKKGPNLVVMPDRARYSNVRPQQIPALVEQHFSRSRSLASAEAAISQKTESICTSWPEQN